MKLPLKSMLLAGVAAGTVVLGSAGAHAQGQTPGLYLGVQGGWTHLDTPSFTATDTSDHCCTSSFGLKVNQGFGAGGTIGYQGLFLPGLRLEGEVTYRENDLTTMTNTDGFLIGHRAAISGNINSKAGMFNVLYDFMPESRWTPYVGVGVGAASINIDHLRATGAGPVEYSTSDVQFAYQGIAGIKYAFTPQWSASVDYRYLATLDPTFKTTASFPEIFDHDDVTQRIKVHYRTQNVFLSVAYHFAPPPPPPPPPVAAAPPPPPAPPPPAPPKQFVVYFEFDKSNLTPEGAKVVQDAAAAFRATGSARVAVAGYTDLAGTQKYNIGLSKRRADTVHAALVRAGVPDNVIAESWHGKENPAVPTPDGVREPRNRRVEIVE